MHDSSRNKRKPLRTSFSSRPVLGVIPEERCKNNEANEAIEELDDEKKHIDEEIAVLEENSFVENDASNIVQAKLDEAEQLAKDDKTDDYYK